MRLSTAGRALVIAGAAVGAVAGIGLAIGFDMSRIPAWMITVGMYKLIFIAAGGLLFAGAALGRAGTRHSHPNDDRSSHRAVGPGPATFAEATPRDAEAVERNRPSDQGA
jgi:hypothetical protein